MAFEDLKENLQSQLKTQWEQFQESSLYIQTKERYENLSPSMQKVTVFGVGALLLYVVLSFPLSYYSSASENVTVFEDTRQLIRDLLKASRESQETPDVAMPPEMDSLQARISQELDSSRLLPEQKLGTEILSETNRLVPQALTKGILQVSLAKLNLRQVVDIGYQLQAISPSVKMVDLVMEMNTSDSRYYDVKYKLLALEVPSLEAPPTEEPPKRGR